MAFDQNSRPKELRPLNAAARNLPEDPRILPVSSSGRPIEGFYSTPPDASSNPSTIPAVYFPAGVLDTGLMPLGFNNAPARIGGWAQQVASPNPQSQPQSGAVAVSAAVVSSASGYSNSSNMGTPGVGSISDEASDDSVTGRKVKFLCSFGGKILPRPSDGALRYVGGQTRIISVRKDISFGEFVQKMADIHDENAVIKYQLPDEDLDALVSVSCPDDLENMMDEYEKLVERSMNGSAKLRILLLSPSEVESAGLVHLGYLQDGGQRYVEAVNGITNGFSGGGNIARKESIESVISAQSSDVSGPEGADSSLHGPGEVTSVPLPTGGLSPNENFGVPFDSSSRLVYVDPNPVPSADASAPLLSIPIVKSGPSEALGVIPEQEVERSVPVVVPQAQPGISLPASSPFVQTYVNPHQEILNHPNYVQLPPQMGFPPQVLGSAGPVFPQQPIAAGASPQQFVPAVHMTINPAYLSMNPNAGPTIVQSPHVRMEQYPAESVVSHRLVQRPTDQGYSTQQSQVTAPVQEGLYNWPQIARPEQIVFSEGGLPPQQYVFFDNGPKFEDCLLCQKALPHAHSDTLAQVQKESPNSAVTDMRSNFLSLHLDDHGRPILKPVATGTVAEGSSEQMAAGARPGVVGNEDRESGRIQTDAVGVSKHIEDPEHSRLAALPQGVVMASGTQFPYGVFVANAQSHRADAIQNVVGQPQFQFIQDTTVNKPLNNDFTPVGMPLQANDYIVRQSPNDYAVKVSGGIPIDDSNLLGTDHPRQANIRLENLNPSTFEVLSSTEQNMCAADSRKENAHALENRPHQIARVEPPTAHTFLPTEPYEVTEPLPVGIQNHYSVIGVNNLHLNEPPTHAVSSGVDPAHVPIPERILPNTELKDHTGWPQSKMDVEARTRDGSSMLPSDRVGDLTDSSASLFANQDFLNMRPDIYFPLHKPSNVQVRDNVGLRDPAAGNFLSNKGEFTPSNSKELPLETLLDDVGCNLSANMNWEFNVDRSLSNTGSSEDLIKQELQAVAEGVAASVLHSSVPSNPDQPGYIKSTSTNVPQKNGDVRPSNEDVQHGDTFEEVKTKLPEKINLGFPTSGIGRLQIIKNIDLEELRELGSGTFGTVYHGKWRGTDVAIKRINDRCFAGKPSEQERLRDDFWNEAIKLADLHHPNVVAFYGVVLDGPDGSIATVTEYMVNGSLRNALQKNERNLDKRKRLLIGMDVAFGMEYLHGKNIVHFDLKSDNLLVNLRDQHRPICKVGDLGLSKVKCHTLISGGVRGTLPWMAPELLNGSSSLVSEKVDVFSFGIVMWELLTGEEPYADLHYGAIIGGIVSNTLRPPVPESCDSEWRSLMERCWASESSERPNFTEIANELRAMAAKLPAKVQVQQQPTSSNPQVKS